MRIFEPALQLLHHLPSDASAGLVMRHSIRFPIVSEAEVYLAGLTPEGFEQAEEMGREIAKLRRLRRLFASPVQRCIDTAASIAKGANSQLLPQIEFRLSHPHIEPVWSSLSTRRDKAMPAPVQAVLKLVLSEPEPGDGSLDIFVTHDTIVAVLAGYFLGHVFKYPDYWPDYLEGVLLWRVKDEIYLRWRDEEKMIARWPLETSRQFHFGF
jgi:hypothetical protein